MKKELRAELFRSLAGLEADVLVTRTLIEERRHEEALAGMAQLQVRYLASLVLQRDYFAACDSLTLFEHLAETFGAALEALEEGADG